MTCEVGAEANRLLGAHHGGARARRSRPIWVELRAGFRRYVRARGRGEGRVRARQRRLAQHAPRVRIARARRESESSARSSAFSPSGWSSSTSTRPCGAYVEQVLAEPDTDLASYQLLGPERLQEFAAHLRGGSRRRRSKRSSATKTIERQRGTRRAAGRSDRSTPSSSPTLRTKRRNWTTPSAWRPASDAGRALETKPTWPTRPRQVKPRSTRRPQALVLDYVIEYAQVHVSPVIARALRVYRERGQVAAAAEFKVTKAPRKTLGALVRSLAHSYDDVVVILGEFEYWNGRARGDPAQYRRRAVGAALLARSRRATCLHRRSRAGARARGVVRLQHPLEWRFDAATRDAERLYGAVDESIVDSWLAGCSARRARSRMTVAGTALATLVERSDGTFNTFIPLARGGRRGCRRARGASTIDDEAVSAALESAAAEPEE